MKITDKELLKELKERFLTKEKALADYQKMLDELGKVNHKLQDSERLKSQFLSNIRNEINNPFASIMGLSRQMSDVKEPINPDRIKKIASLIFFEAFDLNFQLKNIFAAADSEAGEMALDCSRVCVSDFMREVVAEFVPLAEQLHVRIELHGEELDRDTPYFHTDAEKLQLIVGNLLSNAIKFSNADLHAREEKKIILKYGVLQNKLSISVTDEGIGIDDRDQRKIFDSFTQLNEGMTKSYRGHGLGLSVVKAILDLLEGEIQVDSKAMQGSTFVIILPELSDYQSVSTSTAGNEFLFEDGEVF